MSKPEDKIHHSRRLHNDETAIERQSKIFKSHVQDPRHPSLEQSHRFAKKHAMNCGDPRCFMCGNPRKFFNEPTPQEKRLFQDVDKPNNKHSNGLQNDEKDIL